VANVQNKSPPKRPRVHIAACHDRQRQARAYHTATPRPSCPLVLRWSHRRLGKRVRVQSQDNFVGTAVSPSETGPRFVRIAALVPSLHGPIAKHAGWARRPLKKYV